MLLWKSPSARGWYSVPLNMCQQGELSLDPWKSNVLNDFIRQVDLLVDEVAAQQAVLATSYQDWHARMAGVAGVTDLAAALRDLESELNVLGDGLPRGARALSGPLNLRLQIRRHCNRR